MSHTIKAKFLNGILKPMESLNFHEGEEITITILDDYFTDKNNEDGIETSAGGWKNLIDAEELKKNIYADRLISSRQNVKI